MDKLQQMVYLLVQPHAVHMLKYYKEKYDIKPEEYPNAYLPINVVYPFHYFMD